MSMHDLQQAFHIISGINNKNLSGPKSEELILKAEKALSIKLPPTYRLFVKTYGYGDIISNEIYGLVNDNFINSSSCNAVWLTLDERKKNYILPHFIHIASTGDGFYYYLDSSQVNAEGEYPVVIWTSGMPEHKKEKVAEDFGEFLLEQVQQALRDDEEE